MRNLGVTSFHSGSRESEFGDSQESNSWLTVPCPSRQGWLDFQPWSAQPQRRRPGSTLLWKVAVRSPFQRTLWHDRSGLFLENCRKIPLLLNTIRPPLPAWIKSTSCFRRVNSSFILSLTWPEGCLPSLLSYLRQFQHLHEFNSRVSNTNIFVWSLLHCAWRGDINAYVLTAKCDDALRVRRRIKPPYLCSVSTSILSFYLQKEWKVTCACTPFLFSCLPQGCSANQSGKNHLLL